MLNLASTLQTLAVARPVFHSEADFQHALAWQLHLEHPAAIIRLERPIRVAAETICLDIWMKSGSHVILAELKYKTKNASINVDDELFLLCNQQAQNQARYDFAKDISRLERAVRLDPRMLGLALFLTNDSSYWEQPESGSQGDSAFRLHEGNVLAGLLQWRAGLRPGTTKTREQPIELGGSYPLSWRAYHRFDMPRRQHEFRYLAVWVPVSQVET